MGDLHLTVKVATGDLLVRFLLFSFFTLLCAVFYKPKNNKIDVAPDFFCQETDAWLVFPHELEGLNEEEITMHFGGDVAKLFK